MDAQDFAEFMNDINDSATDWRELSRDLCGSWVSYIDVHTGHFKKRMHRCMQKECESCNLHKVDLCVARIALHASGAVFAKVQDGEVAKISKRLGKAENYQRFPTQGGAIFIVGASVADKLGPDARPVAELTRADYTEMALPVDGKRQSGKLLPPMTERQADYGHKTAELGEIVEPADNAAELAKAIEDEKERAKCFSRMTKVMIPTIVVGSHNVEIAINQAIFQTSDLNPTLENLQTAIDQRYEAIRGYMTNVLDAGMKFLAPKIVRVYESELSWK